MKKILALVLALCMIFALAACGQSAAPAATEAPAADAATEAPAADAATEAPAAGGEYTLGMGVSLNMDSSKSGNAQVDATVAAVVLDAEGKIVSCRLDCAQSNPRTSDDAPYLIPLRVALFDENGVLLPETERTLLLNETRQRFVFNNVAAPPIPSFLRDFSAPVYLDFSYTPAQLSLLLAHEHDSFSAWEAGQRLATDLIFSALRALQQQQPPPAADAFITACRHLLRTQADTAPAFVAEVLTLPGEATLAEQLPAPIDPDAVHAARTWLRRSLAQALEKDFEQLYQQLEKHYL